MLYTGRKDAETTAWAEEERFDINSLSRRCREIGGQGKGIGCQQERVSGTDGQRSNVLVSGAGTPGGTIDHLIGEYSDQVAIKEQENQRIEDEIGRLKSKIEELKALKEELKTTAEAKV
jgi:Tfp pilus assembly protein PilN